LSLPRVRAFGHIGELKWNRNKMNLEETQSAIIGKLITAHPGLAEELDHLTSHFPEKDKGQIYKSIFKQPVTDDIRSNDSTPNHQARLEILSADQILNTKWPEPVWAVPGLLPVGLTILAGAPKIGKSWLSLQLAKAIASGGEFLGTAVEKGPVLVCALEDTGARLQKRILAMGWPAYLNVDFIPIPAQGSQPWSMLNGGLDKLTQQIYSSGYRLVVIDTLSRAIPGDQQDVQIMTRALTPLQETAHQVNCGIMLTDHHRKAGGIGPDVIADILGSTAKGAMADTVWSLYRERGKNGAKLSITGRDVEEQTLQLEFDKHCFAWRCLGNTTDLNITPRYQEILDTLSRLGLSSLKEIAEDTGQPPSHTHNRLQELVVAGLVNRFKEGRNIFYELSGLPVIDVMTCNLERKGE